MKKSTDHLKMIKGNASQQKPPELLEQIKANSASILRSKLDNLFSHCDDLFFDLSSRANNNNEQNLYFESMRELRIKRAGVNNLYLQKLEALFTACINPANDALQPSRQPSSVDDLSLVKDDIVEQTVAIDSMAKKARATCQEVLHTLTIRLDHLINSNRINENNNPIDPQQLCNAFAEACELFEIEIKARIIIFKQFERLVVGQLTGLYTTANDLLINAGILPKISLRVSKETSTETMAEQILGRPEALTNNGIDYNLAELTNMLASIRQMGLQFFPNYSYYTSNPGPVMSNDQLLQALSALDLSHLHSAEEPSNDLCQTINQVLAQTNPQQPNALQQPDEDIINLVSMFFDFVLDDKNLPVPIQALISRLQIPILKLALKDRSFFSNGNHPGRKLVNTVAAIGFGWNEQKNNAQEKLYDKVANIIHEIVDHNSEDLQFIESKSDELECLLSQQERRSTLAEKRTQEAAKGQARTQVAKQAAQDVLFRQLDNVLLPSAINRFLVEHWQQLLTLSHIKYGEDSPEWLNATQVSQDLIWACQRQQDEKSKQRLTKIQSSLPQTIADGLNKITMSDDEKEQLLSLISDQIKEVQQATTEAKPLSDEQRQQLGHGEGQKKSWQEMTAMERQQARHIALTYEFIKKAEAIPLNTWLTYEDHKAGKVLRCKLSARIEATDSYIFVNRFGFKVMEKSRKDFAYDMQQKHASPMDQGLMFDRAMSSISDRMRTMNPA
jgi:hypothetical protein